MNVLIRQTCKRKNLSFKIGFPLSGSTEAGFAGQSGLYSADSTCTRPFAKEELQRNFDTDKTT